MLRLSSNMTLFMAIVLPTLYISFFGLFVLVLFVSDNAVIPRTGPFRWIVLGVFLLFVALIYLTIMRLRRVEYQDGKLFVTNYLKSFRYPIEDVEDILDYNFGLFRLGKIRLKQKGSFGRNIYFLLKTANWNTFREKYPA